MTRWRQTIVILLGSIFLIGIAMLVSIKSQDDFANVTLRLATIITYFSVFVSAIQMHWAFDKTGKSCFLRRSGIVTMAIWSLSRIAFAIYRFDSDSPNLLVGIIGGISIFGFLQWALRQGQHKEVITELKHREAWTHTTKEIEASSVLAPNNRG